MEKPMEKFRAYKLTETPEKKIRAEFVECSLDDLDPGNVVVRVAYSDVNYKDALAATGKGKILRRSSCIGGIDFSGTVVSSTDPRFLAYDRRIQALLARIAELERALAAADEAARSVRGGARQGADQMAHRRPHGIAARQGLSTTWF